MLMVAKYRIRFSVVRWGVARRIEPSRKGPEERLDDLLEGHREAALRNEGAKYVARVLEASNSLPNAVKFFAYALLAADAAQDEEALAALAEAEAYLPAVREEMPRRLAKEIPSLRFLERAIAVLSDRAEFEEAIRICNLAMALGLGPSYERKKASLLRMT